MSYHDKTPMEALEAFILASAPKHHGGAGFDDWPALQRWGDAHTLGIDSLPVSNAHCDATIYSRPAVNIAFRAWHDSLHLRHGLDFTLAGEMAVAQLHLDAMSDALGLFEQAAKRILWADTAGQNLYYRTHGAFPENQRAFVAAFLQYGEAAALDPRWTF